VERGDLRAEVPEVYGCPVLNQLGVAVNFGLDARCG
jgi:hypothetical protein